MEPILKMENIHKSFGPVKALKAAKLEVKPGEVHALMGENGAGKSTLMKILTGILSKDQGAIFYAGREIDFKNPKEAMAEGVVIVHQELNMIPHLTVAQNIFIGREAMKGIFTDDQRINQQTETLFQRLNMPILPTELVGELTVGKMQMVEIAKAISMEAKVVVFDEPTAALTESEIDELFTIIKELRRKGMAIVYISHRMDEIKRITDRVTVMRDGAYIGTVDTQSSTKDDIINMMVGRVIYEEPKTQSQVPDDADVMLKVEALSDGKHVIDLAFELKRGEILGFSGLMGAGRTEMARLIFGADQKATGNIYVKGRPVNIDSPKDAIKHGIGYLSEDRKQFGLVVDMSVANNLVLTNLQNYQKRMLLNDPAIYQESKKYIRQLAIKTPSGQQLVRNLSGGNQQKVVIGKWLAQDSEILIFDEPTRGIDVGAKSEIYELMNTLVAMGKSIIMISSELPEVLRMSDRIIVMCEGRKTAELDITEATQEKILSYATLREGVV